jgi:shikimate kinase
VTRGGHGGSVTAPAGYRPRVRRVLVTGMSGTGKSTALAELARRGFRVVDTDEPGWNEWRDDGWFWREDRIAELLAADGERTLYVSGCVSNQGRFYDRFDAVVLLSAPAEVILDRIETRTTNPYGKAPGERELVLGHLASVEPRLRATCTHEIDATRPVSQIVEALIAVGRDETERQMVGSAGPASGCDPGK